MVLLGGAALISAFGTSPDFGSSAAYVFDAMLSDVGRIDPIPPVHAPWWVRAVVDLAGAAVVLSAGDRCCSGAPADTRTLEVADEAQVRALLRDFGDLDSLGYFATRRDKSVVWDTGDARDGARRRLLPGDRLGEPGQRQPGGRPRPLAGGDRAVARATPAPTAGRWR